MEPLQQQTGGMPAFLQESGNQFPKFRKNNNMVIIIVLIAIFLGIAFLIFTYFVQPSLSSTYIANNEFTQKGGGIFSSGYGQDSEQSSGPGDGGIGHGEGDGPRGQPSGPGQPLALLHLYH